MKRTWVVLATAAMLCLWSLQPRQCLAQQKAPPSSASVQQAAVPILTNYHGFLSPQEPCTAGSANPVSRRAWAARLGCSQHDVSAGFQLGDFKPAKSVFGAKVAATVEVTHVVGVWYLTVWIGKDSVSYAATVKAIDHAGAMTLVSTPYNLVAGQAYLALCAISAGSDCGEACAVALTIKELKWELQ